MKKTLFAILALAAVVACNKADVIDSNPGEAIQFGNAFVDNATKAATDPSYNATNLEAFNVYGAVEGVNIFDGDLVSKGSAAYGKAWTIASDAPTQYWIAGANYIFDAVVDATSVVKDDATGLPTTLKYDAAGQKDMLHQRVTTVGKPNENGLVAFTFTHLLSKVKFTVTNNTAALATGYRYTITDIAITGANLTGDYAVAGTWSNVTTGSYSIPAITVASGMTEECKAEVLLIPGTNKVGMTFKVVVEMKDPISGDWKSITTTPKTYTNVIALAANTAYNFNVTLLLNDEIKFTAQPVEQWDPTTPSTTPLQ